MIARHAQPLEPGAEADPALPAPDDHDVWLRRVAELRLLALAAVLPGDAVLHGAELQPERARRALLLLEALQLLQGGEQRPAATVAQAHAAPAAADRRFEGEPGLGDALRFRGLAVEPNGAGGRSHAAGLDHRGDVVGALGGGDVPRERDEVAPVGFGVEQRCNAAGVTALEGVAEVAEPTAGLFGCCRHTGLSGDAGRTGSMQGHTLRWPGPLPESCAGDTLESSRSRTTNAPRALR